MQQWALSINSFFSAIINSDNPELEQSFHAHPFFHWYFHQFLDRTYSRIDDNLDPTLLTIVVSTITRISAALNESPPNSQRNFLFYTASYYAKLLATAIFRPRHPSIVSAVSTVLEALRNYKAQLSEGVTSLEKKMEIPSFSDRKFWDFLNPVKGKPSSAYEIKPED